MPAGRPLKVAVRPLWVEVCLPMTEGPLFELWDVFHDHAI